MKPFEALADQPDPAVPDLSPGILKLLGTLSSGDLDPGEIAAELELYPVIAARLIGLANSAWSTPERTVADLKTACVRLGLAVVKTSAIAYAVAAPFDPRRCSGFDSVRFWCCSLLSGDAAGYLAQLRGEEESVARTGAMLRSLGLVWLADALPGPTNEALNMVTEDPALDLKSALTRTAGVSHLLATRHLLSAWGLPPEILDSCDPDSTSELAWICRFGSSIATDVYADPTTPTSVNMDARISTQEAEELRAFLATSVERVTAIAQSIGA